MGIDFPTDDISEADFRQCYFRYFEILEYGSMSEMAKNEIALKIASDFYGESYTARVISLAEKMYFRTTGNYESESATIKEEAQIPPAKTVVEGTNPFHRYRI